MVDLPRNSFTFIPNRHPHALPGVAMVFSCTKNDELLVPGLLSAFYFCDFFIAYYDDDTDFSYNESKRHGALINEAKKHGAKWVYLTQPTVRLSHGWRSLMARWLPIERPIILHSFVQYFWDYSLDTIRADLTKFRSPCFFRISSQNVFDDSKLHHVAAPLNGERIRSNLVRYNMNRLGREVCLAKADYYAAKDGTPHSSLRDFSGLTTKKIDPRTIRGVGSAELEYIERIKQSYLSSYNPKHRVQAS